jgi:hypothetical protein
MSSQDSCSEVDQPMRLPANRSRSFWACCLSIGAACLLLTCSATTAAAQGFTSTPPYLSWTTAVNTLGMSKSVTIQNTGTTSLTVNSYSVTPSEFILDYGWSPYVILPGKQFAFGLRFISHSVGTTTGTLTINVSGTDVVVPLTGNATSTKANISIFPASLSFGPVPVGTVSAPQTLTLKNIGTSATQVIAVAADPPFRVTGFTPITTLRATQSLALQVTFTGTAVQNFNDVLTIIYDELPEVGVALSGSGVAPTALGVNTYSPLPNATVQAPYLFTFGAVGGTPPYTWSTVPSAPLPPGLSLSSSGTLTGTLASTLGTGNFPFSVQVTDSSVSPVSVIAPMILPIGPQPGSNCNNIDWDIKGTLKPLVPVTDLGTGNYMGYEGGLYPGGSNIRPSTQDAAGVAIAQSIVPLDGNGNYSPTGKYGLMSVGMSVTFDTFVQFMTDVQADPATSPYLVLVPGAQPRAEASQFADPNNGVWTPIFQSFLPQAGLTPNQVVAAWVDDVDTTTSGTFPSDITTLQSELETIAQNLHSKFPNLQLLYFGSRIYGGYSNKTIRPPQDPEPFAYESAFAVKWAIQDQLDGNADLNYNPLNGPVMAPWMSWGAYTWANGLLARSDGLQWDCQDLQYDGTHVSNPMGRQKESNMMLQFFKNDDSSAPWFVAH